MCGIIGYIGQRQAVSVLINGLKKLEYRGYDSSGVALISSQADSIILRKTSGKISQLEKLISDQPVPDAHIGISHTRWATHGVPNRVNAHPHCDCSGNLVVVHNGIIENYEVLKAGLIKRGHTFVSQTDTEVIAHLIEEEYKNTDLFTAVRRAIKYLKGAYALGVMSLKEPETLIAVRIGSPLIIGVGKNEFFIASDVPAILEYTRRVIYLKESTIARLDKNGAKIFGFDGKELAHSIDTVKFKLEAVQKQGFAHFMLKEMHEQPDVLKGMFQLRCKGSNVVLDGINLTEAQLKGIKKIFIIACGTAYHAGLVGKYAIEAFAKIPVSIDVSSEFRYRDPLVDKNTLIVAISQSGETADTLAAVREAKAKGAKIISICNVVGSSLTRESDGVLYTYAGPEIGVASTKAYTAQLAMLYLLAIKLATVTKAMKPAALKALVRDLKNIPTLYEKILKNKNDVAKIAKENAHFGCFLFLGRNVNFPSALEGALKLKEISYIPAEGYAAGEMKHGPIALIDEYRAVVCIAPQSPTFDKMISNIQEIRSRKGKVIAIATEGHRAIEDHASSVIYVPSTHEMLTPFLVALPLQLIAYYIAVARGCDVDQPRNLAKSVTVE